MSTVTATIEDAEAERVEGDAEPTAQPEPSPSPPPTRPALMPEWKTGLYIASSVFLFLTQGLGMNLATANLTQVQGSLAATSVEVAWLSAAYMAPNVSLSIALVKIRNQFGLRNFAEVSILGFVVACVMNLFISDMHSALVVRFLSGVAAAPLSTLGFLYMLEAFDPARKLTIGLSLALLNTTLAGPIARLISPTLLDYGQWHSLYMLEMALALIAFPIIYLLPLTPVPRANVITLRDIASYLLIATGFGAFAIVLTLGQFYWWFEAPWLGTLLASSIVCLTVVAVNELRRDAPLIDIRWLFSRPIMHFTAVLLVFRLIASVQSTVTVPFNQMVGLQNGQIATLCWVMLGSSVVGGLTCAAMMKHGLDTTIHVLALSALAVGAFLDSNLTNLTRPEQMLLGQGLIAAGTALFLPPAMAGGFKAALSKGPNYIISFIAIFLFTQSIGGLIGSAAYGTFIVAREKFHSNVLAEHVLMSDPAVVQRVTQLAAGYGKVITDKALLNAEGLALLAQQVTREANILAYGDAFFIAGVAASLALALMLLHLGYQRLQPLFATHPVSVTS